MSRPCEVGTLVLANTPPSWVNALDVNRSLPEPCGSVVVVQLASGLATALPAADRQATLVLVGVAGIDTEPAGPSTVLSWNGWLNSTVPAARALGAIAAVPATAALISSVAAATRDTTRRASRLIPAGRVLAAGTSGLTLPAEAMAAPRDVEPASRACAPAAGCRNARTPAAQDQGESEQADGDGKCPDKRREPGPC